MGYARDRQDQEQRQGLTSANTSLQQQIINANRHANTETYQEAPVLDPTIDLLWAAGNAGFTRRAPHNYFDYYFTGQDIKVYIDGTDATQYEDIPIMQFAFNIQQEKTPLYGYASYTYDAMLRGTRVITGVMRIVTKDVHFMTEALGFAANARANGKEGLHPVRGLTEDEANIERFWTRNIDPEISFNNNKHLWSSHPPFNLIIVYGLQATSVDRTGDVRVREITQDFSNNELFTDVNERLMEADPDKYSQRRVLENVELTSMQVEYGPDGQVCSEVYSFIARDLKLIKT